MRDTIGKRKEEKTELPPQTVYPIELIRAIKDIKIIDENGNAVIRWYREARNKCEKEMPSLVHKGVYDGIVQMIEAKVNERKVNHELKRYLMKRENNGKEDQRLKHQFVLKLDLTKEKIAPEHVFKYEYVLNYKGVFKDMYKPNMEWTGYEVLVPTDSLTIIITAPKGSEFNSKTIDIRVMGLYEIEDFKEEEKCREDFKPLILQQGELLMWEIEKPKIACTYFIYFSLLR